MKFAFPELPQGPQPSIVLAVVGDNPGRSIEDTLQLVGCLLWRTDQEAATVVDPASDDILLSQSAVNSYLTFWFGTDLLRIDRR